MIRVTMSTSEELKDILIADVALTIAFSLLFSRGFVLQNSSCAGASGILGFLCTTPFLFYLPIAFVAVTLSFVLHEYMHKKVAQHFGAIAAFQRSDMGILIALATSFLGFLMALPGATVIYTNTFTKKEDGYTSIVGPLTNFAVFGVFYFIYLLLPANVQIGYVGAVVTTTLFISLWLAFVNMLPIYPLDGSKVLRWNKPVYIITLIVIIGLLVLLLGPSLSLLYSIVIVLVLSLIMSGFARNLIFR